MDLRTYTVTLRAPCDPVFNFLADIENLPRWAASFCERLYIERGRWKGLTALGEAWLELDACRAAGVIDVRAGTSPDRLALLPIRVMASGEKITLVDVTFASAVGWPTSILWRDAAGVAEDLRRLATRFGGGEVHMPARDPQHMNAAVEPEVFGSMHFFV